MQRSYSTTATRACRLGEQRVASRVPRLASKVAPATASLLPSASNHQLSSSSFASAETSTARRSISKSFGLLAGSTVASRTGLLRNRHLSTCSQSRGFSSTSPARDLKQDAAEKIVEQGKKYAKSKLDSRINTDQVMEQAQKLSASKTGEEFAEQGAKFAKDTLSEGMKGGAKSLAATTSRIVFALLAVAGTAYLMIGGETHAEEQRGAGKKEGGPKYSKDQVSLLCLVGPSLSGKTTQAKRLVNRFKELDDIVQPKSFDELLHIISERAKPGKRTSLVVDNFPTTLEDAQRIEKEIVPIFCFSFYDLPLKDFEKRLPDKKDSKEKVEEFKRYTEKLQPLVKQYRDQGNIYEISADWESADEVWEQVEAKTEQILELRERGDL